MPAPSDTPMSRRTALALLGTATGMAILDPRLYGAESVEDKLRTLLPRFSGPSRALLGRIIMDSAFMGQIAPADVAALAKNEKTTVEHLMLELLPLAKSYSHAPISNFFVGVVVRGASGTLYLGANLEIPGQCLGFAVHAEQSALAKAYMNSELSVPALAVVGGAPCGHCRQFMEEISPDGEMSILVPGKPARTLSSILPDAFGPAALGAKQGALPARQTNLTLTNTISDPTTNAALEAARNSYAPYSKSPAGVAIRTERGRIYRGSYIENVAFNPSLSPLQTALTHQVAAAEPYSAISAVALVEIDGAKISQRAVTETVLSAIAPKVKLQVKFARG